MGGGTRTLSQGLSFFQSFTLNSYFLLNFLLLRQDSFSLFALICNSSIRSTQFSVQGTENLGGSHFLTFLSIFHFFGLFLKILKKRTSRTYLPRDWGGGTCSIQSLGKFFKLRVLPVLSRFAPLQDTKNQLLFARLESCGLPPYRIPTQVLTQPCLRNLARVHRANKFFNLLS